MYQAFYNIQRIGKEIYSDSPVSIELAYISNQLLPLMREDKEFFGICDLNGTTLQAMYYEDEDKYWFEVPRPELEGAFGRFLSFDEAEKLIESLNDNISLEGYQGFVFESWQ